MSVLKLDKLILKEAAKENFSGSPVVVHASIMYAAISKSRNGELVENWGNIAVQRDMHPTGTPMKTGLLRI